MPTHVGIHVYSTNCNNCHKYNIIEKRSEDDKRYIVNFDYLREFTPDNVNELVAECIKLINKD